MPQSVLMAILTIVAQLIPLAQKLFLKKGAGTTKKNWVTKLSAPLIDQALRSLKLPQQLFPIIQTTVSTFIDRAAAFLKLSPNQTFPPIIPMIFAALAEATWPADGNGPQRQTWVNTLVAGVLQQLTTAGALPPGDASPLFQASTAFVDTMIDLVNKAAKPLTIEQGLAT